MFRRLMTVAVLVGLLVAGKASNAQAPQSMYAGQPTANPSGWSFDIAPYVWLAHINTTNEFNLPPALGGTLSTSSSLGFGDVLSHLNFALMVAADVRYDRFSVVNDFLYMNLGGAGANVRSVNFPSHPSIPISSSLQTHVGMNLNSKIDTLAGGYTVLQGGWGNLDVIVGVRYLGMPVDVNYDLALTLTGPRGNGATFGGIGSVSGSTTLWNGIGGFRGSIRIRDSAFFIPYYFDAGAGSSQLTWQIASGLGYHVGGADVSITYRYLSFEQNSGITRHMSVGGPMIMANFKF
jgi:hypothetical protein